jgi:leucyl aminopeptidase
MPLLRRLNRWHNGRMSKASPYFYSSESSFTDSADKAIPLRLIRSVDFDDLQTRASASFSRQMEQTGFTGKEKQLCILRDEKGDIAEILAGVTFPIGFYAFAHIHEQLKAAFTADFLKSAKFKLDKTLGADDVQNAATGWALAGYRFDLYKKEKGKHIAAVLVWPEGADKKRVTAMVEGLCLIKTLINIPANHLGTDELSEAAAQVARQGRATFSRIVDKDLLEQNFPMISDDHPMVTLVGKGIVFDTGGLDLKPPPFMLLMKKDMGGAAHVLGLAHVIMALNLPVRLRVLIAIAENSVGGAAFRPGDVLSSRKGITVEVSDTDAEGRLVVGDALTYASEGDKKPELIVDFCTLTGSARAALGYDIPAFFSNRDELLDDLKKLGQAHEDPIWPLPLWQPYLKEMNSSIADLNNIGSGKAGAVHGALFLHQFVDNTIDWVHMDCYAWEQSGKAGRPQGGADTGMRAVLKLIEKRFAA